MNDYIVWVLRDEYRIEASSRYQAAAQGVRMYLRKHPNSRYNWSQLMTLVRTKRVRLVLFGGVE